MALGRCTNIWQVDDIVEAAKKTQNVLFYSVNRVYDLIDFLYQDSKGHFHIFQATTGLEHSANFEEIKQLEAQVGGWENLSIYYLVPGDRFNHFLINHVDLKNGGLKCAVWKVLIPDPDRNGKSWLQKLINVILANC